VKNPLILGILLISLCYSEEPSPKEISQVGIGVEIDGGDDDGYYDDDGGPIIWIGPGIYYGIWFDTEWEYNDWYGHHHHGHGGGHHDHHDGGHHGSGGHHGGGGGHHGGGGGHHGGGGGGHHK
jgi:hypothetical protein